MGGAGSRARAGLARLAAHTTALCRATHIGQPSAPGLGRGQRSVGRHQEAGDEPLYCLEQLLTSEVGGSGAQHEGRLGQRAVEQDGDGLDQARIERPGGGDRFGFHGGAWDDATAEAEAARTLHDEAGTRANLIRMESMLGLIWLHRGQYDEARGALARAEADFARPGHDVGGIVWLLWLQASLADLDGNPAEGARLLGAAFDSPST